MLIMLGHDVHFERNHEKEIMMEPCIVNHILSVQGSTSLAWHLGQADTSNASYTS